MSECFDGETYDHDLDHNRLTAQFKQVFDKMSDGNWYSLADLERALGHPQASISARIRDFRKQKFGGHKVERRRTPSGYFEYRLTTV